MCLVVVLTLTAGMSHADVVEGTCTSSSSSASCNRDVTHGLAMLQQAAKTEKRSFAKSGHDEVGSNSKNAGHASLSVSMKGEEDAAIVEGNAVAAKGTDENAQLLEQPGKKPGGSGEQEGGTAQVSRIVIQMVFGILYYITIVSKYPSYKDLPEPNQAAKDLQEINEVSATCQTSVANCLLSWCCSGPRAAHTFYSTLGLNYFFCCLLMSCFPCCTLWYVNSFTELNEKLGGEKRNMFVGLICACLCSCCVIAQDAESLDRVVGVKTGFCGISDDPRQDVAQGATVTQ